MRIVPGRSHFRILAFVHFCILALMASTKAQPKVTLVGLTPRAVEAKIGKPDEIDTLADSDEVYWTYKTQYGELSVHFQNGLVIGLAPEDFPLEKILKSPQPLRSPDP
jgi:hypothetical protein